MSFPRGLVFSLIVAVVFGASYHASASTLTVAYLQQVSDACQHAITV
jgi:hypothetical protein